MSLSASNRFQENLPITIGEDCKPAASWFWWTAKRSLLRTAFSAPNGKHSREVQRSVAIDRARLQDSVGEFIAGSPRHLHHVVFISHHHCHHCLIPTLFVWNLTLMAPYRRNYGPLALSGHVHLPLSEDHCMSCLEASERSVHSLEYDHQDDWQHFFGGLSSSLDRDCSDIWSEAWSEETCRCAEAKICEMFLLLGTNMCICSTYSLHCPSGLCFDFKFGYEYRSTQIYCGQSELSAEEIYFERSPWGVECFQRMWWHVSAALQP